MKNLNQFCPFDLDAFLEKKVLKITNTSEWKDYDTKKHLGTKIEVVIIRDETEYTTKNGDQISNLYEKFSIKVSKDISPAIGTVVVPVDATATVYGEYRNQLSVTASDIKELQSSKAS